MSEQDREQQEEKYAIRQLWAACSILKIYCFNLTSTFRDSLATYLWLSELR